MFHEEQNQQGQQFQTAQDNIQYLNFNRSQEIDRQTITKQQFRKTVKQNVPLKFQKISLHNHKFHKHHHKNPFKNISFQSQPSLDMNGRGYDQDGDDDGFSSLGSYYQNNQHAELIYKKTKNLGTSWIGQRQYFTSIFASPQSIEKMKSKCLYGKNFHQASQQVHQSLHQQLSTSQMFSISKPMFSATSIQNSNQISFDSDFQSGNLYAVYKVGILQFDLLLQNDINTKGNTQWFYFRIKNLPPNKNIKLNIVNFRKSDSLFNYGMLPCIHSSQKQKKTGQGWIRKGQKVKYYRNSHHIEGSRKFYFTLTFTILTQFSNDIIKVAQCYPYTYSDLNRYMQQIQKVNYKRNWCQKITVMHKTLGGNKIESLVIKQQNPKFKNNQLRPLIILLARQHPGQTPGSFMMQGLIQYFLSKQKDSQFIRKNYQIRAIPMVNPDGVKVGNYRTNLYGVDLNRNWDCSTKQRQSLKTQKQLNSEASQIIYIKRYIATHAKNRQIAYVLDFHGHSRKLYSFFYGNTFPQNPSDVKMFPYVCSKLTSMIRYEDCTFNIDEQKRSTARVQLFSNLKISNIYTFQASFFGFIDKKKQKRAFTIENYKNLGLIIGKAIYICQKRKEETQIEGKQKFLYEKWFKELTTSNNLIKTGQNSDSGSQSCPQECQIQQIQKQLLQQQFALQKQQSKRKANTSQKLARQKFRQQNITSAKEPVKSLRQMQVLDIARVNSIFPNDVLALVPNTFYLKSAQKPKKQMKNREVQTDSCPIIKVYQSCKVAENQLGENLINNSSIEGQSTVFQRSKAKSIGSVIQSNNSSVQNGSSLLVQNAIKNFSSLSVGRSKSIHQKQLFENARHMSALKKSTQIRKHFKKVLTEHQLTKPKSELIKNDGSNFQSNKKIHRYVQTIISFQKQSIVKHNALLINQRNELIRQSSIKLQSSIEKLQSGQQTNQGIDRQKLCESKFFYETPQKKQKKGKNEMRQLLICQQDIKQSAFFNSTISTSANKYWTIESRRKSLGLQSRQLNTGMSRNQFRKTTIMTKNILRSNSNNYYQKNMNQNYKIDKNEKLMQNWRIKKKSLI